MSIEQINGYNKLPSRDLRKADLRKAAPEESKKPGDQSGSVSQQTRVEPRESLEISREDRLDLTQIERPESVEFKENLPVDSLELSWRDPDLVERIRRLIDDLKETRSDTAQRIEAARILIMSRAYDDDDQLMKTAEAILRGEDVDEIR